MTSVYVHTLSAILLLKCSLQYPLPTIEIKISSSTPKLLDFLKKFGYIEDDITAGALYTEEGISEKIKLVQKFGALNETGILDNATLALMSSPRCGVPDIIRNRRQKRYAFGSEGWKKNKVTYFIANWSPKLGEESVSKSIKAALDIWARYSRLEFRQSSTPDADIIVAFGSSYHGDRYPFDGPGYILAHAFFPYEESGFGGDIHFDADENWIELKRGEEKDGMDFFTVALHELGHSLGLSHSTVVNSVMFPYYKNYGTYEDANLGYDDILAMYELYIRKNSNHETTSSTSTPYTEEYSTDSIETSSVFTTEAVQTTTILFTYETDYESVEVHKTHEPTHNIPPTNSPNLPNICDGRFDAIAAIRDEIFIFKEEYVWRLKEMTKILPGYPILIKKMFPKLPENVKRIDAAYERPDGMIILFTGNQFWVYDGKEFVENSPQNLSFYGVPKTIDKIDAVQVWAKNGKTYIYKNDRFWRYNETTKKLDEGYPKHIERWRGVPQDVDAATTWGGITYFFKDDLYWRFNNDWIMVTEQSPLPSPQLWLGCPEDERTLLRFREQ